MDLELRKSIEDFNFGGSPTIIDTIMMKMAQELQDKKGELIKTKLSEKGFGHLLGGIENRLFSKLARIKHEGWEYYYADNDTDEGAFIVAIKDVVVDQKTSMEDYGIRMNMSFNWQDTMPLKIIKNDTAKKHYS